MPTICSSLKRPLFMAMVLLRRYHRDVRSPILAGGVFRGQVKGNLIDIIGNRISELEQSQQVLETKNSLERESRFGSRVSQGMLNWIAGCATKPKSSDNFTAPWIGWTLCRERGRGNQSHHR